MLYLNEDDIIGLVAEKCNVKPEDVTLKVQLFPEVKVTAIVDEKPEDDGMIFVVKKDQIDPETWDALMKVTKEGKTFHIFEE